MHGNGRQVLGRAPAMRDFRMTSSRVGPQGGIALAQGLSAGARLLSCAADYISVRGSVPYQNITRERNVVCCGRARRNLCAWTSGASLYLRLQKTRV